MRLSLETLFFKQRNCLVTHKAISGKGCSKSLWPEFLNHPKWPRIRGPLLPWSAMEALSHPREMPAASLSVHLQEKAQAVRSLLSVS